MVGGASWVLALSLFNVTIQLSTPRWVVGRGLALYQTAVFGGMALGAWLWGLLAEARGADVALLVAAAAMLAGALAGLAAPLPNRADLDLDPLDRFRAPSLALDLQPRSGPVAVSIEFRIREADIAGVPLGDARPRSASAGATAPGTGRCCATSRIPSSGPNSTRPPPGSTTCATTSAPPRPTPRSATACAPCTPAPTGRASAAASSARPAGSTRRRTPARRSTRTDRRPTKLS